VNAPIPIWVLFVADLAVWHVPVLYGLTLRNQTVHDLEHLSFLVLAVLFWAQVIESPPLRPRLSEAWRVGYVTLAATACWVLAMVLAFAPSPLYVGYESLGSRPGGISAMSDQQLAAGIMWGPGSIPFAIFVFLALYRWLGGRTTTTPMLRACSVAQAERADPTGRVGVGPLVPRS
jgi:cytochrome c oxidase assembly factor CtaG